MPIYQTISIVIAALVGLVTLVKQYRPSEIRTRGTIQAEIDRTELLRMHGSIPPNSIEIVEKEFRHAFSARAHFAKAALRTDWRNRLRIASGLTVFLITTLIVVGFFDLVRLRSNFGSLYIPPRYGPFDIFLIVSQGSISEYYVGGSMLFATLLIGQYTAFVAHSHLLYWRHCNINYYGWARPSPIVMGAPIDLRVTSSLGYRSHPRFLFYHALDETLRAFDRSPDGHSIDTSFVDADFARRFEIEYDYRIVDLFVQMEKINRIPVLGYFVRFLIPAKISMKLTSDSRHCTKFRKYRNCLLRRVNREEIPDIEATQASYKHLWYKLDRRSAGLGVK